MVEAQVPAMHEHGQHFRCEPDLGVALCRLERQVGQRSRLPDAQLACDEEMGPIGQRICQ